MNGLLRELLAAHRLARHPEVAAALHWRASRFMPRSFRGLGAINGNSIYPAPAFVPLAERPDRSDEFGDMGKLAELLKGSLVRGDNRDRPDDAFLLPLAHQVGKGHDAFLAECRDSFSKNTSLP